MGLLNTLSIFPESTAVKVCCTECEADRRAGPCAASVRAPFKLPSCCCGRHAHLSILLKHKAAYHKGAYHKAAYHKAAYHEAANDPLLAGCMEFIVDISSVSHVSCWLGPCIDRTLPSQASQQFDRYKEGGLPSACADYNPEV